MKRFQIYNPFLSIFVLIAFFVSLFYPSIAFAQANHPSKVQNDFHTEELNLNAFIRKDGFLAELKFRSLVEAVVANPEDALAVIREFVNENPQLSLGEVLNEILHQVPAKNSPAEVVAGQLMISGSAIAEAKVNLPTPQEGIEEVNTRRKFFKDLAQPFRGAAVGGSLAQPNQESLIKYGVSPEKDGRRSFLKKSATAAAGTFLLNLLPRGVRGEVLKYRYPPSSIYMRSHMVRKNILKAIENNFMSREASESYLDFRTIEADEVDTELRQYRRVKLYTKGMHDYRGEIIIEVISEQDKNKTKGYYSHQATVIYQTPDGQYWDASTNTWRDRLVRNQLELTLKDTGNLEIRASLEDSLTGKWIPDQIASQDQYRISSLQEKFRNLFYRKVRALLDRRVGDGDSDVMKKDDLSLTTEGDRISVEIDNPSESYNRANAYFMGETVYQKQTINAGFVIDTSASQDVDSIRNQWKTLRQTYLSLKQKGILGEFWVTNVQRDGDIIRPVTEKDLKDGIEFHRMITAQRSEEGYMSTYVIQAMKKLAEKEINTIFSMAGRSDRRDVDEGNAYEPEERAQENMNWLLVNRPDLDYYIFNAGDETPDNIIQNYLIRPGTQNGKVTHIPTDQNFDTAFLQMIDSFRTTFTVTEDQKKPIDRFSHLTVEDPNTGENVFLQRNPNNLEALPRNKEKQFQFDQWEKLPSLEDYSDFRIEKKGEESSLISFSEKKMQVQSITPFYERVPIDLTGPHQERFALALDGSNSIGKLGPDKVSQYKRQAMDFVEKNNVTVFAYFDGKYVKRPPTGSAHVPSYEDAEVLDPKAGVYVEKMEVFYGTKDEIKEKIQNMAFRRSNTPEFPLLKKLEEEASVWNHFDHLVSFTDDEEKSNLENPYEFINFVNRLRDEKKAISFVINGASSANMNEAIRDDVFMNPDYLTSQIGFLISEEDDVSTGPIKRQFYNMMAMAKITGGDYLTVGPITSTDVFSEYVRKRNFSRRGEKEVTELNKKGYLIELIDESTQQPLYFKIDFDELDETHSFGSLDSFGNQGDDQSQLAYVLLLSIASDLFVSKEGVDLPVMKGGSSVFIPQNKTSAEKEPSALIVDYDETGSSVLNQAFLLSA